MKRACVSQTTANEADEPLVVVGNPEVLQREAASAAVADLVSVALAGGRRANITSSDNEDNSNNAHQSTRAHSNGKRQPAGEVGRIHGDATDVNRLTTSTTTPNPTADTRAGSTGAAADEGESCSFSSSSPHHISGGLSSHRTWSDSREALHGFAQGHLHPSRSAQDAVTDFDVGSHATPVIETNENLLKFIGRQLPSRATPEAKMLYLQQKEALLERRAKSLARTQVWGAQDAGGARSHEERRRVSQRWSADNAAPLGRTRSASGHDGVSKKPAPAPWHGPLAALHLVPRPITLPWADADTHSDGTAVSSACPSPACAERRTEHPTAAAATLSTNDSTTSVGGSARPVTRVVRMTASDDQGIELAFELTFRPSRSNPCSPVIPDPTEAETESPTPDEFFKTISHVPFVLTYLHGDNELSEETSRLAYAVPLVRKEAAAENKRGGADGTKASDRFAEHVSVTRCSANDGRGDPLHRGGTESGSPLSPLEMLPASGMQMPTVTTTTTTTVTQKTDVGASAAVDRKTRALAIRRMNRKWRVVFPFVNFARPPTTQSVHVLYVSQAQTKYGEILGVEVPIVIMEPPRIRVRLQQAPHPRRAVEEGGEAVANQEEDEDREQVATSGDAGTAAAASSSRAKKRNSCLSNKSGSGRHDKANEEAERKSPIRLAAFENVSFTSQTPSIVCQLPDESFLELVPQEHGASSLLEPGTPPVLTAAYLKRMEEQQGQEGQQGFAGAGSNAQAVGGTAAADAQATNVLHVTGDPHETLLGRILLDIEADDIVFDVEFSIRALVGVRRLLSTYAKEFLPSELIRYVYVPPAAGSCEDDPLSQSSPQSPTEPQHQQRPSQKTSPTEDEADDASVIRTRWVVPVVAPLVVPLPASASGTAARRRSPSLTPLCRGTSAMGAAAFMESNLLARSLPNAASNITSGAAEGSLGPGAASMSGAGRPPVPPLHSFLSAEMAAATGPVSGGHHLPAPSESASSVVPVIPQHCRLVLQVDVRLASLPRQVFRETFPLTVLFPSASRVVSSHGSLVNTPRSLPIPAAARTPLQPPGLEGSAAAAATVSGVPPLLQRSSMRSGSNLDVPVMQAQQRPSPSGNSSGRSDEGSFEGERPKAAHVTASAPTRREEATAQAPGESIHSISDELRLEEVRPEKTVIFKSCSIPFSEGSPQHSMSVEDSSGTHGEWALSSTNAATAAAAAAATGSQVRGTEAPFASTNDTSHSVQLRISAPASRSSSPSASPAFSAACHRKISLAHVSVSTFAICRSGAILSYYRNDASPDESELGFSPLNAMNQCAPVNLHGLEKFALLLAERLHRQEDKAREERAKKAAAAAAAAAAATGGTPLSGKRKHRAFEKDPVPSLKQESTVDTSTSPDTDPVEAAHNRHSHHDHHNSGNDKSGNLPATSTAATFSTSTPPAGIEGGDEGGRHAESKRHRKHHHKHRHRDTHDSTRDRLSEDVDSSGGIGGVWRIFEDAIGWRLERSIDANYVLLRERGTCQCFAFRMRGTRSKRGQETPVGGKRMSKLDLAAVACFEPELPPLRHFAAAKAGGGKAAATIGKPVKQQYLLSEREVLTLTQTGDLFLTEASTVEKMKSDDAANPATSATSTGLTSLVAVASATSGPRSAAQQQILQQMQNFTLRVGTTMKLPLPAACSRFTAWMLENDNNYTLILVATKVAGPENERYAHRSHDMANDESIIDTTAGTTPDALSFPYRKVLVYCVEEKRVLYEFQLGVPSSIFPCSAEVESLFPPSSPSIGSVSSPEPRVEPAAVLPLVAGSVGPSAPLPLLFASTSASICGFTVVSAHEESAMAIAWTPYQADVLTCCPNWAHFSLFFVTPSFVAVTIGNTSTFQQRAKRAGRPPALGADSSTSEDKIDPVEDLLTPLGMDRPRDHVSKGRAAGRERHKACTGSNADSDSGLLTILCVCPGDRAPHALVGAAEKTEEKEKQKEKKESAATEKGLTTRYAEEFLAFFLLSNGAIYVLTAPKDNSNSVGASKDASKTCHGMSLPGGSPGNRSELAHYCASHWVGGDMYIHVDEGGSPSMASPVTSASTRDFPVVRRAGSSSVFSTGGTRTSPARTVSRPFPVVTAGLFANDENGAPGPLERELRVVRVGTVFNASFHTSSAVENCAMRYCPVDRDFLDVRGMLYLYGVHASTKELVKDAIVVE